jgi:uncharacterized membrane protein (Fun14 family)
MDFYKVRGPLDSWKPSGPSSLSAAGGLRDSQIESCLGCCAPFVNGGAHSVAFRYATGMFKRVLVLICLVCASVLAYFAISGVRTVRVEDLKNLVERNIKIGASPDAVRQFLVGQGLDPSPLRREPEASYGGRKYGNFPVIVVLKRNTARTLMTREDVQIIFVFSEKNELVRFDLFPVFTGF